MSSGVLVSARVPRACPTTLVCPARLCLQGLADTFLLLGMPFDSPQAAELNRQIFETIYFAALRTSMQLAKTEGACNASGTVLLGQAGWRCADPLGYSLQARTAPTRAAL